MTTIAIYPENPNTPQSCFRAVAGGQDATGKTAGQALDALAAQVGNSALAPLLVFKSPTPDCYFDALKQARLRELMDRWRS